MSVNSARQFLIICPTGTRKRTIIYLIFKCFRKRALKTHPDKGGDPVEFKKINEAYNKLIGHIFKVRQLILELLSSFTTVL